MILTELFGGLGNQLFQYAAARAFQRERNEPIVLDTRRLGDLADDIEKIVQRPLAIDIFPKLRAEPLGIDLFNVLEGTTRLHRLRLRWLERRTTCLREVHMQPLSIPAQRKPNVSLKGYFQTERYFAHLRPALLDELTFPPLDPVNAAIEEEILATPDAVSIHVRRGDYLASNTREAFGGVTLDYYRRAVASLAEKLQRPRLDAVVFSDDIEWAREHLAFHPLRPRFVDGNLGAASWRDMRLMSKCQHHVIANSSFSWWGAWLAQRPGTRCAPRHWFHPKSGWSFDIERIVPQAWTVVDHSPD